MVSAAHFSTREMGVYASLPFLLGMVSNFAGGYLCDWLGMQFGIRRAYRAITPFTCLTLTSVLLLGMSFATSQLADVVLATVSFATMDLMLPAAWAMCMSIGGPCGARSASGGDAEHFRPVGWAALHAQPFGYIVSGTGNYNIPVRVVAIMVFVAALIFSRIDCTAGMAAAAEDGT